MANIIINRNEYAIPEGEKLNAIQMSAQRAGDRDSLLLLASRFIGRRQLPDVRDRDRRQGPQDRRNQNGFLKLVPACQTPAKDLTVLVTDSPKVKEHQRMIMEYLLLNHPLDCPVCDQAGECAAGWQGLQLPLRPVGAPDSSKSRAVEPARKDAFGPLIQLLTRTAASCARAACGSPARFRRPASCK